MKIIFFITLFFIFNTAISQDLPILKLLRSKEVKYAIKAPVELTGNDICVTVVLGGGMSAYDSYNHYIFYMDGAVRAFKEELPKSYLKKSKLKPSLVEIVLDNASKKKLVNRLHSKENLEFSGFNQEDFYSKKKSKVHSFPCVSDAAGYAISYIQNNKQSIMSFYAPKYYAENKCKDERIDKVVLAKFINVLQLWEVMEKE